MNVCHPRVAFKLKITAPTPQVLTNALYVIRDICVTKENVWVSTQHEMCYKDHSLLAWQVFWGLSFIDGEKSLNELKSVF